MKPLHRIVIDCDPGIDDALALMLAAASAELDILAVTCVAGNRPVATTTANACRVLDVTGRHGVPVHAGCERPLAYEQARCNLVHGKDGLGGVPLPPGRKPHAAHAVDALATRLLQSEPGGLSLVALGPLTNLALVEIRHPGILRRARQLVIMGGAAFRPGNVTPSAEFNFYADPLAAHVVLSAGAPVTLFGLDVTSKAEMPGAWIDSLAALRNRCGRLALAMLRAYAEADPLLHDACPVAWLLEPALFAGKPCALSVDWRPGPTEGHLSAWTDEPAFAPRPTNAHAMLDVDSEGLLDLLRSRLATLP